MVSSANFDMKFTHLEEESQGGSLDFLYFSDMRGLLARGLSYLDPYAAHSDSLVSTIDMMSRLAANLARTWPSTPIARVQ